MQLKSFLLFLLVALGNNGNAQQSDNEDGTYTNPVIWSDFPDNDVIRVGDTYYMVATTMYTFPGVPVLKSKDLVNWEYAANTILRFDQGPAYNLQGGQRYGRGQWASSIRFHNGKFYILFLTLDEGGFLCTADKAEGPWKLQKLPKAYYDAGLFFDDDGKNYIVSGFSKLSITAVNDSLAPLGKDSLVVSKTQRPGLEGSHMYKINGYYYIYATYGGPDGYQACLRSKNVYGPYEEKIVLKDDMNLSGKGVHQGALIETAAGEWWSIIFQDRVGIGRAPTLQPVTWVDGWPVVGQNGRAVVTYKKPDAGKQWPVKKLPTSDEFDNSSLGMQWSWNHNPDDSAWSLTERKGFLRLKAATVADSLPRARNTLTQRTFGPYSTGTILVDTRNMHDGDVAGLGILQLPYAFVGVKDDNNTKTLVMVDDGRLIATKPFDKQESVYLRAFVNATRDAAYFYYSSDNKYFIPLGDTLHMQFNLKMFTGNKFAIFNYATKQPGGFIDVDWFRMDTKKGPANLYKSNETIEAEMYDEINAAKVHSSRDTSGPKDQDITNTINGSWIKFNQIDFIHNCKNLEVRLKPAGSPGKVLFYLDKETSQPYAVVAIPDKNATDKYTTFKTAVRPAKGRHSLIIRFECAGAGPTGNLNWVRFTK